MKTMNSTDIKDNILNPNKFNVSTGNSSLELWNRGNTITSANSNKVYKTIYSPSPTEYLEPKSVAFTGFSITGSNTTTYSQYNVSGSFNKGWNFYCQPNFTGTTIYFAALGFRATTDEITQVNSGADYWSSDPSTSSSNARFFYAYAFCVYPYGDDLRVYGFPLKPVMGM